MYINRWKRIRELSSLAEGFSGVCDVESLDEFLVDNGYSDNQIVKVDCVRLVDDLKPQLDVEFYYQEDGEEVVGYVKIWALAEGGYEIELNNFVD